jgi:DNA-binding MarR family transcriptional regulator
MRRRVEDNADTRSFLFGFQRALAERKPKLPAHSITVLLFLSAQPEEAARYKDAMEACDLTPGQMDHAVDGLIDAGLVTRSHDDEDARRTKLTSTKKGLSVISDLIANAQSVD